MKTKLWAVLFSLLLISACALAEIDLTPYEVPSECGTEVKILAPNVYLLYHDGVLSNGKLKTALVLLDHGKKVFEQFLPDHASNGQNLFSRLWVADRNHFGIATAESHSDFIRFQSLENNVLSEGFSVKSKWGSYAILPDFFCILAWQGALYAVDRFDSNGILLASTPVFSHLPVPYDGFTVLSDKSICYIASDSNSSQNQYAINHLRVSPDGELLSRVHVVLPKNSGSFGAFSPNGGMLSYTDLSDLTEFFSYFLVRSDSSGQLLFAKTLKASDINVSVSKAVLRDDGSTTVYGIATRTAHQFFIAFKLELDANGRILSRDIRDFTTRVTYLYNLQLDTLGNAYVVANDYSHPIAIVPFEDLPAHDDPGLVLE